MGMNSGPVVPPSGEAPEEVLAVYDESMERVGSAYRGKVHHLGLWHRSTHVWVIRPDGFVLFQKRSRDKKVCPNLLDTSCAGHFGTDACGTEEGIAECTTRELREELGITASYGDEIVPVGTSIDVLKQGATINREICHVHFLSSNLRPHEYRLPVHEVEGLVEMSVSDGLRLFSGSIPSAYVEGIEWDWMEEAWTAVHREVTVSDFIPRVDTYHFRVFKEAQRWLVGEDHICV